MRKKSAHIHHRWHHTPIISYYNITRFFWSMRPKGPMQRRIRKDLAVLWFYIIGALLSDNTKCTFFPHHDNTTLVLFSKKIAVSNYHYYTCVLSISFFQTCCRKKKYLIGAKLYKNKNYKNNVCCVYLYSLYYIDRTYISTIILLW